MSTDFAWHPMDPDEKSFLQEDCEELLEYLGQYALPGSKELLDWLNEGDRHIKQESLEHLVFLVSRLFAICAFDHEQSLEPYKADLVVLLQQNPELKVAIRVYRQEVELGEINDELPYQTILEQTNRLEGFLDVLLLDAL